jgi:hypothetical protein
MITAGNLSSFVRQLRQNGVNADATSKHDPISGVHVGLVVDGRFYSLTELSNSENRPFVDSLALKAKGSKCIRTQFG